MCVGVMIMISSSGNISGGLILRSVVRTFFGLLTNRRINFWWARQGKSAQVPESLLLAALELPDFVRNVILCVADLVLDDVLLLLREFPGAVVLEIA